MSLIKRTLTSFLEYTRKSDVRNFIILTSLVYERVYVTEFSKT